MCGKNSWKQNLKQNWNHSQMMVIAVQYFVLLGSKNIMLVYTLYL